MLAVGFVLVAVLGGVVVKRVAAGITPAGVLGLAAGIAGIWLVVRGWQVLVRPLRHRWVAIAVAVVGTLVVAQFLLLPAVMAFDAVARPQATSSGRTPADLGLAADDVSFRTSDGVTIAGWWVGSSNGEAVIVLPGAGSTRDDVLEHAALLARAGYGALLLDLRGHGQSEGPRNEFGWGAERDVIAAIDWLEARPELTGGIGVLGLSMGAEVALTAAAADPRVDAVVAEGASARTFADLQALGDAHPVGVANAAVMFGLVDLLSAEDPPVTLRDAVAAIDAPVLVITSGDPHEVAAGPVFRDANPERVSLWALPDAPHIGGLAADPDAYRDRLLAAFAGMR
jgi:dienelactone hydrolase